MTLPPRESAHYEFGLFNSESLQDFKNQDNNLAIIGRAFVAPLAPLAVAQRNKWAEKIWGGGSGRRAERPARNDHAGRRAEARSAQYPRNKSRKWAVETGRQDHGATTSSRVAMASGACVAGRQKPRKIKGGLEPQRVTPREARMKPRW
jgi:hypothetical protein